MSSPQAVTLTPAVVHPPIGLLLPEVLSQLGSVRKGVLLSGGTAAGRALLVVENSFVIVDAGTGKILQSWVPPPEAGTINHVAELSLGRGQQLLVVGLEQHDHSVLAVLSSNATKLLRTVAIPEAVTSIYPFCDSAYAPFVDDYHLPDLFQDSALAHFSGLVAVGCVGGRVYLVNLHLNLDDLRPVGDSVFSTLSVMKEDCSLHEVKNVGEGGQHSCIQLNGGMHQPPRCGKY